MHKRLNIDGILILINGQIRNFGLNRFSKNLISIILVANLTYTLIRYSSEILAGGHPYLTGDWLINYEGGYNGRGLFGQITLWIADTFGTDLLWTTFTIQAVLYVIYFFSVISIFRTVENRFAWAIGLSPFFVMFEFLDTGGAFRKELLGFASLALIALLAVHKSHQNTLLFLSTFLFVIFLFSWEMAFCFIPFYLYLFSKLYLIHIIGKRVLKYFSILFLTLGVTSIIRAFYFIYNRPTSISDGICNSLINRGLSSEICGGTIYSLTELEVDQIRMIRMLFIDYDFGFYILLIFLGLLPFILNGWLMNHLKVALLFFVSVIPLFLSGADYGRWIHIFGVFLTIAWVIEEKKTNAVLIPWKYSLPDKIKYLLFFALSLIYTGSWRIPTAWGSPEDALLGVAGRLLSWFTH